MRCLVVVLFAHGLVLFGCESKRYVIGRFPDAQCQAQDAALFCSGFERPDLSDWSGRAEQDDAEVVQTDARAYAGRGALHARSNGPESTAVVVQEFGPVVEGDVHLRARLYVPSELPTETMNLFFLGDEPAPDPFSGVDFNLEDGAPSLYSPQAMPDRVTSGTVQIPRDDWFCLRIELTVSDDAGAVRVYVDDELAVEQLAIDTLPDAGVHLLRAGVDWSSGQSEPFEVYIDDLVLDTAPLACQ